MKPTAKATSYTSPDSIDLIKVKGKLRNIKTDDKQGYRREKPGLDAVIEELPNAMAQYAEPAAIHMGVYQGFLAKTETIRNIRSLRPVVAALNEALEDSELFYEEAREADIVRIAKDVLDAVGEFPDILAAFEKTMKYRSQYAEKAVATRRKNEEEAAARTANASKTKTSKVKTSKAKSTSRKTKTSKSKLVEDKPQSPV